MMIKGLTVILSESFVLFFQAPDRWNVRIRKASHGHQSKRVVLNGGVAGKNLEAL